MNRRNFLKGFAVAAGSALLVPELLKPQRTFFLPPSDGWSPAGYRSFEFGEVLRTSIEIGVDPMEFDTRNELEHRSKALIRHGKIKRVWQDGKLVFDAERGINSWPAHYLFTGIV